jgi:hypothetical protein
LRVIYAETVSQIFRIAALNASTSHLRRKAAVSDDSHIQAIAEDAESYVASWISTEGSGGLVEIDDICIEAIQIALLFRSERTVGMLILPQIGGSTLNGAFLPFVVRQEMAVLRV